MGHAARADADPLALPLRLLQHLAPVPLHGAGRHLAARTARFATPDFADGHTRRLHVAADVWPARARILLRANARQRPLVAPVALRRIRVAIVAGPSRYCL